MLMLVALVSSLLLVHAQEPASTGQSEPSSDEAKNGGELRNNQNEAFKKLFVVRRKEHLRAVTDVRSLASYERKYEMISIMIKNMIEVIESRKKIVEGVKNELKKNQTLFYADPELRDAVSSVLENAALFGDVVLQLPDITHRILKKQKNWREQMHWSLRFANETRFLLDEATVTMLDFAFQELNVIPRQPTYHNPFASVGKDSLQNKKIKEKKKRKRSGPQLIHVDL